MCGRVSRLAALGATLAGTAAVAAVPVAVDVGHYLEKPGATSAYGVTEFEYNQTLAAVIAARLERDGVPVRLIGYKGEMADLYARAPQAEAAGGQFFLSVHHDSVRAEYQQTWIVDGKEQRYSEYARGFSLFVSRKNPRLAESLACASAIGAALREAGLTPTPHHAEAAGIGRPWADQTNGVYYYDNLVVLKSSTVPAVLLEAGVIVHPDEALALATPARRALTAEAVAKGLAACGVTAGRRSAKIPGNPLGDVGLRPAPPAQPTAPVAHETDPALLLLRRPQPGPAGHPVAPDVADPGRQHRLDGPSGDELGHAGRPG